MAELNQDQTLATGQTTDSTKAKAVAVDPKAKEVSQSGRLTPDQRIEAIKTLLQESIDDNKARFAKAVKGEEGGGWSSGFAASYQTSRGLIVITTDDKSKNPLTEDKFGDVRITLITQDTKQTSTERTALLSSDGEFVSLNRSTKTYMSLDEKKGRPHKYKENETLSNEWAERFTDNLIKDAFRQWTEEKGVDAVLNSLNKLPK